MRSIVLIDFDGVINQFPDRKVRSRQNSVDWMKPDDPRRAVYDPANWFIPDRREKVDLGSQGRWWITWSSELVRRLGSLDADIFWLSTWQPYTGLLNRHLDVDWQTIDWYDPITNMGRLTGKRRAVLNHLRLGRPIIWIDDEETTYDAGLAVEGTEHTAAVLGVGPNSDIGISRPQMTHIEEFAATPPADASVQFLTSVNGHEGHWGF
ncbi:hypothetical protein [Bifidobacterium simiarum]|uniref:hypothetical protein n=1 Tax=Bifidobacterium simiarum TaxID=2045441 RepID=UPI001BDC392E|nr:hypothetical protein [Bifidobacterium simiarum]MBT1165455.1 hypothetical protein [Bifidobacterium simiarum]